MGEALDPSVNRIDEQEMQLGGGRSDHRQAVRPGRADGGVVGQRAAVGMGHHAPRFLHDERQVELVRVPISAAIYGEFGRYCNRCYFTSCASRSPPARLI